VLGQKVEVHYGNQRAPWEYFVLFSTLVAMPPVETAIRSYSAASPVGRIVVRGLSGIASGANSVENIRQLKKSVKLNLSNLFSATTTHRATDPRDKVYALLGMVTERYRPDPDYTFTNSHVYTLGMKAMLQSD